MMRFRARSAVAALVAALVVGVTAAPVAADEADSITAYLDGKPIPTAEVGNYFCDDFSYPAITCSATPLLQKTRATLVSLFSSADYVTVWEGTYYSGASMNMSEDYSSLVVIGWNDRVSSFKARNGETGRFTTDWFYSGTSYYFCCNSQVSALGTWNNTFSAVERT